MIEILASKLAVKIKKVVPEHPATEAVLKFSLALVINALLIIILSITLSFFTGKIKETLVVLVSFAILRQISGGLHLKSGIWCVVGTTSLVMIISLSHPSYVGVQVLNVTGILLAMVYAPSGIEKQSRIPTKYYPVLKVMSCLLIASNLLIQSPVLALSFFVQCLTLIQIRR